MITLIVNEELNKEKISITLTQGLGWNNILYPLVRDGEFVNEHFPDEPGIFMLSIKYGTELFFREWILYRSSPIHEELGFSFYREHERIFCTISSARADELNKEVVLNPLPEDLRAVLNELSN
jgi:hypothetical protein